MRIEHKLWRSGCQCNLLEWSMRLSTRVSCWRTLQMSCRGRHYGVSHLRQYPWSTMWFKHELSRSCWKFSVPSRHLYLPTWISFRRLDELRCWWKCVEQFFSLMKYRLFHIGLGDPFSTTRTTQTATGDILLGDMCSFDADCQNLLRHSTCLNGQCACRSGYLPRGNNRCVCNKGMVNHSRVDRFLAQIHVRCF